MASPQRVRPVRVTPCDGGRNAVLAELAAYVFASNGEPSPEDDVPSAWTQGAFHRGRLVASTFRLATDGKQAECEKLSRGGEVQIRPQGLASLLAGQSSLSQLLRIDRASGDLAPSRLAGLDALFSTRFAPYCMNEF